jgi:hypothetical protein
VQYVTVEEAAMAIEMLHRSVLDGRSINVRYYRVPAQHDYAPSGPGTG